MALKRGRATTCVAVAVGAALALVDGDAGLHSRPIAGREEAYRANNIGVSTPRTVRFRRGRGVVPPRARDRSPTRHRQAESRHRALLRRQPRRRATRNRCGSRQTCRIGHSPSTCSASSPAAPAGRRGIRRVRARAENGSGRCGHGHQSGPVVPPGAEVSGSGRRVPSSDGWPAVQCDRRLRPGQHAGARAATPTKAKRRWQGSRS